MKIVKNKMKEAEFARHILPIFGKEDFDVHERYLLRENPRIKALLDGNPKARKMLYDSFREQYSKDRTYLSGAKAIDSLDRITSGLSLLAESYPGIGQVVSGLEEVGELAPKILYGTYYTIKSKDYKSIPYYALAEVASFIPFVGDVIDLKNLYINRARKTFRRRVAESFLEKLAKNAPKDPSVN